MRQVDEGKDFVLTRGGLTAAFLCFGKFQQEAGSLLGIFQSNIAAHLIDNALADRKAQAAALGTALDKGLEQSVPHGLGDSGAVVIKPEDMGKCSLACLCPYGIIEA